MQFRVLYANPEPIPSSVWEEVEHGISVIPKARILAVQFRDPDEPLNLANPMHVVTEILNTSAELITDENGRYRKPSDDEVEAEAERIKNKFADDFGKLGI
jgi:hypothetical protein